MKDNPKKKKADGKRVALEQGHERRYLLEQLELAQINLGDAKNALANAVAHFETAGAAVFNIARRLKEGMPKESKRGKKRR